MKAGNGEWCNTYKESRDCCTAKDDCTGIYGSTHGSEWYTYHGGDCEVEATGDNKGLASWYDRTWQKGRFGGPRPSLKATLQARSCLSSALNAPEEPVSPSACSQRRRSATADSPPFRTVSHLVQVDCVHPVLQDPPRGQAACLRAGAHPEPCLAGD